MEEQKKKQIKQYANLGIFQLGFFMVLTGILIVKYAEEFVLNAYQVSLYLTLNYAGYMGGGFGGGTLSKRLGQKRLMDWVLVLTAVTAGGYFVAASYTVLCILSFTLGVCGGVMESRSSAVMGNVEPERPDHNMNICLGMMTGGYLAGCSSVVVILFFELPWRLVYVIIIITALLSRFRFRSLHFTETIYFVGKNAAKQENTKSGKAEWINRYFVLGCLAMCLYTGMEVMFFSWLTTYFESRGSISFLFSVLIMCAFYMFLLFGKFFNNVLMNYSKPVVNAACAATLSFILMNLLVNLDIFIVNCLCAAALGFSISCIPPFIIAFSGKQAGSDTAYSYIIGCGGIGTVLIPGVVGVLSARFDMRIVLMIMSPAFLIIAILFGFVFYPKIKKEELI